MRPNAVRIASLLAFGLGCGGAPGKQPAAAPPTVIVDTVTRREVTNYVEAVGVLDGYVNAEIRARVSGYLKEQVYEDGTRVRAGQLMFVIDPAEYKAGVSVAQGNLARAEAALALSETQLKRSEGLVEMRAIAQEQLDRDRAAKRDAHGQVEAARAALKQAELDLSYTQVRSPVEGRAGLPLVRIGNLVGQDEPTLLTTVSQIDPIRVRFSVSEVEYLRYAQKYRSIEGGDVAWAERQFSSLEKHGTTEDQRPSVELALADGSIYPRRGVIVASDRAIDASTGTIRIEALFPNPDQLLRPGQYGRVRFERPREEQKPLVVAEKALVEVQGTYSVAVVGAGDKVELRRVAVGARDGSQRVITDGVKEGERVVVEGVQKVSDGAQVVPKPKDQRSSAAPIQDFAHSSP